MDTGTRHVPALRLHEAQANASADEPVAVELPVALEYNGVSHVVMLATPLDLDDFALGFSLTEGLIDSAADLLDCEAESDQANRGMVLHLRITARCEMRLKERRRNLAGRTGCGLCGTDSLDQVFRMVSHELPLLRVPAAALYRAMRDLPAAQPLQQQTGGVHAAAWCALDGSVQIVREDVGRHNALDKLIGAMARAGIDAAQGFIATTSRASLEMVQKSAMAGAGLLATVSAPTQLAIEVAQESGLTLLGFVRDGRATVYCGSDRMIE